MKNRKRVLLALSRLPYYRRDMVELLADEYDLDVVHSSDDNTENPSETASIDASQSVAHEYRVGLFRWQRGLFAGADRRFDYMIFTGDVRYISTWFALLKARALGIPTATWGHGWSSPQPKLINWIRTLFYRIASEMWVYTETQADYAAQRGVPRRNIHVVGNAANDLSIVPVPTSDQPRIGFVGRLLPQRSLGVLLDAFRILLESGRPVDLEIIGTGHARTELQQRATHLGIPVTFLGAIYDDHWLTTLMARWSVVAIPSHAGLSVITALSQGLPVIVSDDEGANGPEWTAIKEGQNGFHFRGGDATSLAEAIAKCLDSPERESMSFRARESYENEWSPQRLVRRFIARIDLHGS